MGVSNRQHDVLMILNVGVLKLGLSQAVNENTNWNDVIMNSGTVSSLET